VSARLVKRACAGALAATLLSQVIAVPAAFAVTADQSSAAPALQSVGTGLHRDLPPVQLVPDETRPPNGAAEGHPQEVAFRDSPLGLIYTDPQGRTLYQMKMGQLRYWGTPETYCTGPCATVWKALAAPAEAKPIGAWHVVNGAQGPQWAYGKFPVFTFAGDKAPGDLNGHEYEDMFMAIGYIPPPPPVKAPGSVAPLFVGHKEYVLAYRGQPLYGYAGERDCAAVCDNLMPLAAGMGSKNIGDWAVLSGGDRDQWTYRNKRVFVATSSSQDILDPSAVLRP
jgi:predicted lipoprotein with Yx(FWY)xxD motif